MTRSPLRGFLQSSPNIGWSEYNNGLDGQRFAALDRINTRNVTQLKRVCELTLGEEGTFQSGPIVVGDRMFVTTALLNLTDEPLIEERV